MAQKLQLTHNELVLLVSNLVLEAQKEMMSINEQDDGSPGPLQFLHALIYNGEKRRAPEGSPMAKQADEYYRRQQIAQLLRSEYNKDIVTSEFRRILRSLISEEAKANPKSLWSITRKLYPKNNKGEPDDLWIDQQVILELFFRHRAENRKIGYKTIMDYDDIDIDAIMSPEIPSIKGYEKWKEKEKVKEVPNERQKILKNGGYNGLSPTKMLERLFGGGTSGNINAAEVDAVFSTLVEDDIDIRAILVGPKEFLEWQNTNKQQKAFFKEMPQFKANIGIPDELSEGIAELIDLYQAPFKNSKEGNAFRGWMHELFPEWRAADGDKLDKRGSHNNSWINQAWRDYGVLYSDVTKDHELLSYKDWLKKNRLKDNTQMAGYYKDYLKGNRYRHDDIKHGEYINPTAPIFDIDDITLTGRRYESPWIRGGPGPSCIDCHAFLGSGWVAGNRPNEAQEAFMGAMGFNYPAYDMGMNAAFDIIRNFDEYLADVPAVKWFVDSGYHLLIDICSFVCYLICPATAGIGCAASVGFDILNAYAYIYWDDKADYYSAGLQMAFAIVPGGELAKHIFKRVKPFLNKLFQKMFKGTITEKYILEMVAKMTPASKEIFRQILKPYAHHFPTKGAVEAMETQLNGWLRAIKPYMDNSLFNTAKQIKDWALRNFRWWIFLVEQVLYDPGQSLFTLVGDLSDKYVPVLGLKSYTDKLKDWPKVGLNFYNFILERYDIGGMEAIVQTSIQDCQNKVYNTRYSQAYDFEEIKKLWKKSPYASADPHAADREYLLNHERNQIRIDKAKSEQESGFKTKEDNNLREYKPSVGRMEKYEYTPINGEWHRRLRDTEDEWVNMHPKGDLWDEDKFRDDWFSKGWRPSTGFEQESGDELSAEELAEIMATNLAMQAYTRFKTCKTMMEQAEFDKYFDDCKLFISMWLKSVEQDSEENKIRTAMDLVWFKHCK